MYKIFTPDNIANRSASSLSIAKAVIELDKRAAKFLSSNLVNDRTFINERVSELTTGPSTDFYRVIVQVIDRKKILTGDYDVALLTDVVNKWAAQSRVTGARGQRLALVSQPLIDEDGDFEHIEAADGTPIIYIEAWISTAVIYNHRRATLNHCRNANEFAADVNNLFEHILDLNDDLDIAVEHQKFGVFQHGNITF
jgi:hypothetical protein